MSWEISFKFDMRRILEKFSWSAFFFLSKGNNIAVFGESGIAPCESEKLIIVVKMGSKVSLHCFKTHAHRQRIQAAGYFLTTQLAVYEQHCISTWLKEERRAVHWRNGRKRCNTKISLGTQNGTAYFLNLLGKEISNAKAFAKALSSVLLGYKGSVFIWSKLLIVENKNRKRKSGNKFHFSKARLKFDLFVTQTELTSLITKVTKNVFFFKVFPVLANIRFSSP